MKWIVSEERLADSVIEHLLLKRGILEAQHQDFLNPELIQLIEPRMLHDSVGAAQIILEAIAAGKKIFIHGDYDVDGVCATAIMWDFLYRVVGADVHPLIPSRFDDGYGLSESTLDQIVEEGGELVITVDCGIRDNELIKQYQKKGLEFIITDHHSLDTDDKGNPIVSESALAVVHPSHPDGKYEFPQLSGTAVAWKFCAQIANEGNVDVDMNRYLDLVAMATVCDIMPLHGQNRILVREGLNKMRKTTNVGLKALMRVTGVNQQDIQTYHFGFVFGPRINAAGRLDTAMTALRLLSTQSFDQADKLALELNRLNTERQKLTQELLEEASAQIAGLESEQSLYFVVGEDWPEGIIGLISGKLAEKHNRPVIVGSMQDGVVTASGRSPKGFHLAEALANIGDKLDRYGGHAQAAGLSFQAKNQKEVQEALVKLAKEAFKSSDFDPELEIDIVLEPEEISIATAEQIAQLEPFGMGNPTPSVMIRNAEIIKCRTIGNQKQHMKLIVEVNGKRLDVIHFNGFPSWEGMQMGDRVDLVGALEINEWQGRRNLQIKIMDIRKAE